MATQTDILSLFFDFHPNLFSSTDNSIKNFRKLSVMDSMAHHQPTVLKRPVQRRYFFSKKARTPFTVNSKAWYDENYCPHDRLGQSFNGTPSSQEDVWKTVHTTAGLVYGVAKIFVALCNNFRVDLHIPAANILGYIRMAEDSLKSGSVIEFAFAIEELYFNLFARLDIELAFLHFCISFGIEGSKQRRKVDPALPEPSHVYAILATCRELLNDSSVCSSFDERLVWHHQRQFVEEMTRKYQVDGTLPPDATGYRAHIEEIVQTSSSDTYQQWLENFPQIQSLPIEILAFLSEKYLPIYPRTLSRNSQLEPLLPFIDPGMEDPEIWDRNMVHAHRLCALAQLEGKAVGQLRREEDASNVLRYASEQKCVCLETCTCSQACSKSGSTLCPCSSRWLCGIMIHRSEYDNVSFEDKNTILGELAYESLACLKRGESEEVMRRELYGGINIITDELKKQRTACHTEEVDIVLVS